jgi:hypothetical protein
MNKLQIIGIIFMSYLLAACTTAEPAPRTTAIATPTRESVEEPVGSTAVEPTAEPTTTIQEDLTPIPEETAVENTPEERREILSQTLPAYLMSGNYQALEALMGDSFVIGYWRSEGQALTPVEAVEQLRLNLLPDPTAFRFTSNRSLFPNLGDVDPTKAFGPQIKVVDLVYSEGWGADGQGEALLAIGLNVEGQYWPGMIYAPAGFEEGTETNDGSRQGLNTYVNEHAGYAFDYPADWILIGEPHPSAYNYVITIQSFMLGGGTGSVPADQAKLDFVTCNSAECNTLQAVQAQIDEQVAAGTLEILSEENWTLAGGIPAIRRQVVGEMGMEVASLLTEIDSRALRVSGYGDLAAFEEIVRTLRPAITVPSETGLRAIIEIPQSLPKGEPVKLQFFLINDSDGKLYVLNWFTPLEGLGGEIFRVKRDGVILPYQGPLASRVEPGPDSYTMLEAGEIVSAEVNLSTAYDFSTPGNYTVEFISPEISHIAKTEAEMATTFDELGPVQIVTNKVELVIRDTVNCSTSIDGDMAEEALIRFFFLLNQGKYAEATALYGGEYEMLMNFNPTSDPADHAHLLEMGCTVNGLQCLPARSIQPTAECSNPFEFSVQFENPDGSLFIQNPGGDWSESTLPRSTFQYTVIKTEDGFFVQELPVYVP